MKSEKDSGTNQPEPRMVLNVAFTDEEGKPERRKAVCPATVSYGQFFKVSDKPFVLSKQNVKDRPMLELIQVRCGSGLSVNEDDIYYLFAHYRYRRKDCVRMLRRFHKSFPNNTRLEVVNGLWTVIPIPFKGYMEEAGEGFDYETPDEGGE